MASNARKASSTGHTDQERARPRGKGHKVNSHTTGEGYIFEGEIGLRGYRTPEEDARLEQKRYHPPATNPEEGL